MGLFSSKSSSESNLGQGTSGSQTQTGDPLSVVFAGGDDGKRQVEFDQSVDLSEKLVLGSIVEEGARFTDNSRYTDNSYKSDSRVFDDDFYYSDSRVFDDDFYYSDSSVASDNRVFNLLDGGSVQAVESISKSAVDALSGGMLSAANLAGNVASLAFDAIEENNKQTHSTFYDVLTGVKDFSEQAIEGTQESIRQGLAESKSNANQDNTKRLIWVAGIGLVLVLAIGKIN